MADHGAAPRTRGSHSGCLSTGLSEANLVTQQSNTTIFYDPEYPDATSTEEVRVMVGSKRSAECLSAGNLEPNAARDSTQPHDDTLAAGVDEHIPAEEPLAQRPRVSGPVLNLPTATAQPLPQRGPHLAKWKESLTSSSIG